MNLADVGVAPEMVDHGATNVFPFPASGFAREEIVVPGADFRMVPLSGAFAHNDFVHGRHHPRAHGHAAVGPGYGPRVCRSADAELLDVSPHDSGTILQRNRPVVGRLRTDAALPVNGVVVGRAALDSKHVDEIGRSGPPVDHGAEAAVRFGLFVGAAVGFDHFRRLRCGQELEIAGRPPAPQKLLLLVDDDQVVFERASDTRIQRMVSDVSEIGKDFHPLHVHGNVEGVRVVVAFRLVEVHQQGGRSGEVGLEHAVVAGVEDRQQPAREEPVAYGRRRRGPQFRRPVEEGVRVPRVHAHEWREIVAQTHETHVVNPRRIRPVGRPFAGVGGVRQTSVGQGHQGPCSEYGVVGAAGGVEVEVVVTVFPGVGRRIGIPVGRFGQVSHVGHRVEIIAGALGRAAVEFEEPVQVWLKALNPPMHVVGNAQETPEYDFALAATRDLVVDTLPVRKREEALHEQVLDDALAFLFRQVEDALGRPFRSRAGPVLRRAL